ncbi:MAG: membrane dipeptidase [Spirochaetaceae bacterium]|nr:membrane dipeptidase [Spirochaetaceae bacterium]
MLIVDSHLDIAFNAVDWNRDLTQSITSIREAEAGMAGKGRGAGVVSFEELRRGGMGLIFVTVHCRLASVGKRFAGVRTQDIAYARAMGELAYYRRMEARGFLRQIRDLAGLDAHLAEWEQDPQRTPIGFVLTMEGADPIVGPEQVGEWWDEGLRVVSLVHYGISSYSHGTQAPGGLTERGGPMLDALERAGILLDVSHLAEQAFREALDRYGGPVLATHNCCRALCDHDRQLDDDQIRALAARGGVIGTAFDDWMLSPLWDREAMDNTGITLATVGDHIDHICQVTGSSEHAAIGTDLDGGYGREQSPADLYTIADVRKVAGILKERGYGAADVGNVMHGNWVRLLRSAWSEGTA